MSSKAFSRSAMLSYLADEMCRFDAAHPLRVGIDGIDAAGKTTLADELAQYIHQHQRPIIRASIDGFHNPRAIRYRRGLLSPQGYYDDAFDYQAAIQGLLLPLGPGGDRYYRSQIFDYRADCPISEAPQYAPSSAILLVDGVFLQRPELLAYWDMTIFVHVPFELALARALARDTALFGSESATRERYAVRYIPAQQYYLQQCQPYYHATCVLDNSDPANPILQAV